ncbi:MAG: hypothetical protein GXO22_04865 [Aquificae bacterium]|nr:hypothetical protein [Aquificota bacterium]
MKKLALLLIPIMITSCAVKKEKKPSYKSCDEYFAQILQKQKTKKAFKVYSYVYIDGKHLLMKGDFNEYGGGTMKFYLPIGKKVATVEKNGEEFCIKEDKNCKKVSNPFRKLGISVEKILTQNFMISKNDSYRCNSEDSLIIEKPGFSLIYKDGKLKNVLLKNLLIRYDGNNIYIYDMGELVAQFKIEKIIYER